MADMTTIKGRIQETIYPNGTGAITAEKHQALLLEMVDDINMKKADQSELIATKESLNALEQKVDNLPQGEEFDKQGNYPLLHVGTADDLAGRGESVPAEFGFRASGGKSIKDGRAYIKRIKGNSVVWNQLALKNTNSYTAVGVTATWDGSKIHLQGVYNAGGDSNLYSLFKQFPLRAGHKYALILQGGQYTAFYTMGSFIAPDIYKEVILEANGGTGDITLRVDKYASTGQSIDEYVTMQVTDLTQMFQAGNEPTTIEEFNARVATLGIDIYAYNEGQVIHCNTESIKSVGDNAWDEEWGIGRLNTDTGQPNYGNNGIFSKNYIRVLPNETYYCGYNAAPIFAMFYDAEYNLILQVSGSNHFINIRNRQFTTPANAVYMRFYVADNNITTYNNDIMISLVHSGWKQDTDAGYQPYWQDTLPLPIISNYFRDGMKSAGTAHDEIRYNKASGKWEYSKGKIKSVDMGDMAWSYDSANQVFTSYTIMDLMTHPAEVSERNKGLLCSKYSPSSTYIVSTMDDKSWLRIPKSVTIKDTSYTDAATFKAAMAGVILYYEAADWEWEELDAEDQNFRDYYQVADFGTEQSQSSVPSAAFSADIIYQFNAVDMIREHEIEIAELQKVITTMQAQLTSLTNGGQ